MAFTTTYPNAAALVLTDETPGALVKSPKELLELGPPGQPDRLVLTYHGFADTIGSVNADRLTAFPAVGSTFLAAATAGVWIVERTKPGKADWPFYDLELHLVGLATAKPDAVRWFANTETQQAERVIADGALRDKLSARILSVGVEIDRIVLGTPNMSQVGANVTPPSAPSVRASDWATIVDPTYHFRNGWVLVDLKSQQLAGSSVAWLCTYVYNYIYPFSP